MQEPVRWPKIGVLVRTIDDNILPRTQNVEVRIGPRNSGLQL